MISLCRVLETINESYALEEVPDSKAIAAVRAGLNIDPNFWKDFFQLCNSPGLSILLGVDKRIISQWHTKIQKILDYIARIDSETGTGRANMISTGF